MLFEDKTQNNIMLDLIQTVNSDISTEEGTLINHSFCGAATEFERVYMGLGLIDQNGYAPTADREHLILRARESGIIPYGKTKAIWKAEFNGVGIHEGARFSAGELTYICTEKMEDGGYRLMCEQAGKIGNIKQKELTAIEYINGYESGKLTELLIPARDDEETEAFRSRYLSMVGVPQGFGGNRAQYKKIMLSIEGVGACKIYRVTQQKRRIEIYFLNALYEPPSNTFVSDVQEIIDPIGKQGEGEGEAAIFHVVDIFPCKAQEINIETKITIDTGYEWEILKPMVENKIIQYFSGLAKTWEDTENIIVRILRINAAIGEVEGIVDVQNTKLNNNEENMILDPNTIPVKGVIICKE